MSVGADGVDWRGAGEMAGRRTEILFRFLHQLSEGILQERRQERRFEKMEIMDILDILEIIIKPFGEKGREG